MTEALTQYEEESWAIKRPWAFGATMVGIMFGLKILAVPLLLALGDGDTTGPVLEEGFLVVLVTFAILPLETFLGQSLPIWLLKKMGVGKWFALCTLSGAFFGVLHLGAGLGGWVIGFIAGVVLSYCWLSWRSKSIGTAFWFTTAVHAVHNAIAFHLYMIAEALE